MTDAQVSLQLEYIRHQIIMFLLKLLLITFLALARSEKLPKPEKIVDGSGCETKIFPYTVSIKAYFALIHVCGGSLINGYNVLTAAHCVRNPQVYFVVAGQSRLDEVSQNIQISPVMAVLKHPKYDNSSHDNDIAILRLKRPILESPYTKYVHLPPADWNSDCSVLDVAGWGQLYDSSLTKMMPVNLRCASLPVLNLDSCRDFINPMNLTSSFCTLDFLHGVCFGDSGGPLMCQGVQYGIVSWGLTCIPVFPQVHTNLTLYNDFINGTIKVDVSYSTCLSSRNTLSRFSLSMFIIFSCFIS